MHSFPRVELDLTAVIFFGTSRIICFASVLNSENEIIWFGNNCPVTCEDNHVRRHHSEIIIGIGTNDIGKNTSPIFKERVLI